MKPCGPHTALWRLLAATNNLNIGMFNLNFDMKSGRARFSRRRARRGASKGSRTSRTWTGSSLASSAPSDAARGRGDAVRPLRADLAAVEAGGAGAAGGGGVLGAAHRVRRGHAAEAAAPAHHALQPAAVARRASARTRRRARAATARPDARQGAAARRAVPRHVQLRAGHAGAASRIAFWLLSERSLYTRLAGLSEVYGRLSVMSS